MKISKLFHWLYAIIMLLPIAVIPIFAIYSHRHTIDNYAIEVSQNIVADFNQILSPDNLSLNTSYVSYTYDDDSNTYDVSVNVSSAPWQNGLRYGGDSDLINSNDIYLLTLTSTSNSQLNSNMFGGYLTNIGNFYYIRNTFVSTYGLVGLFNSTGDYNATNPMLFNLTQMFGSGNEPSITEFREYFPDDYYEFTLSKKILLKNTSTITYNDTDIGSQMLYSFYNTTDKYFALNKLFGLGGLYDWFLLNMFGGNCPLGFTIFWNLLTYWLIISIFWLLFDVMIYVPQLVHRWLDKGVIE